MRRLPAAGLIAGALIAGSVLAPATSAGAAAAKSVLLGKYNKTTHTTTIKNTKGTPLTLTAGKGKAPLAVNSSKTVTNLSADKLDGHSSGAFANASVQTGIIWGSVKDADGYYNTARCPKGTVFVGGGGVALGGDGDAVQGLTPDYNESTGKFIANSWITTSAYGDAVAFVTCYNPKGKVKGAATTFPSASDLGGAAVARLSANASPSERAAVAKANHQKAPFSLR